jgi:hypothetical protein
MTPTRMPSLAIAIATRLLLPLSAFLCLALLPACAESSAKPKCSVSFALEADEEPGPQMRPGNNCLRCHAPGKQAASRPFSFGGTVFPAANSEPCSDGVEGVTIDVTDSKGRSVSVMSNEAGNFWTAEPLTPPFRISAKRGSKTVEMPIESPTGGCALCHSAVGPVGGAKGSIRPPE